MKLVIAEKPSVAQTIAKVLGAAERKDGYVQGGGYIVSWCVGHLVGLSSPEAYDEKYKKWSFDTLPIIPEQWKFSINAATKKQFYVLKVLMDDKNVDEIICATDAGREGENIFRYVYNMTGCRKPFKRLWTSSLEESAIRDGFNNLKNGREYDNLYAAGLCRAEADWLVGMNGTRLFSIRYNSRLNIGRVQTPTLAMIVQRDYDVSNFVKQKYYTVELDCGMFTASSERIDDESKAHSITEACNGRNAVVALVKKEVKSVNPPKLYDLTTLQREANRQYGYTAKQTLDITQSLYEQKLVTYPRTDSQYITDDMERTAAEMVKLVCRYITCCNGINIEPDIKRIINNKKVSDHHALLPTAQIAEKDLNSLPESERNILYLVSAKLICAVAEPHKYEAVKAVLTCENSEFTANGKTVINDGWKRLDSRIKSLLKGGDTEEKSDSPEKSLPELTEHQTFENVSAATAEHWTSPPKPFTEDTLLSAMETAGNKEYDENSDVEKKGLGTPATRAAIIESLVKREYVERNNKQLVATDKGVNLINVVPDEVKSPKMTAAWETELQKIEKGVSNPDMFMKQIQDYVKQLCINYGSAAENSSFSNERTAIGTCPKCGKEIKKGKFGYYCTGKCGMNLAKVYGKELTETQLKRLLEGKEVSYTANGKKTIVLPEVFENNYQGKIYFQWKTKER